MNTTVSSNQALWLGIIPLVVPVLIAVVKTYLPKIPKALLPILCPLLGAGVSIIEYYVGMSPEGAVMQGAILGAAGVFVREVWDQLKKAGSGSVTTTASVIIGVIGLLFMPGCASFERTSYRTIGTTNTLVEKAMYAWGDYVETGKATVADQIKVKELYLRYQASLRVARDVTLELKKQQAEGISNNEQWASVLNAVDASAADLLDLIALFLPDTQTIKPANIK